MLENAFVWVRNWFLDLFCQHLIFYNIFVHKWILWDILLHYDLIFRQLEWLLFFDLSWFHWISVNHFTLYLTLYPLLTYRHHWGIRGTLINAYGSLPIVNPPSFRSQTIYISARGSRWLPNSQLTFDRTGLTISRVGDGSIFHEINFRLIQFWIQYKSFDKCLWALSFWLFQCNQKVSGFDELFRS